MFCKKYYGKNLVLFNTKFCPKTILIKKMLINKLIFRKQNFGSTKKVGAKNYSLENIFGWKKSFILRKSMF